MCYSPDGKYIASGSWDKTIKLWEVAIGRNVKTLQGHTERITSVVYSPNGKYVASGSWDKTIKLWEVATGKCIKTLTGDTSCVDSVAYSPDGNYIASCSWDKTIKLWEIATGRYIKTFEGHTDRINSVCYSPNGKYIASGSEDNTIKLWAVATGECIKTFAEHTDNVNSVAYSPDGKYIASGSDDCTIKLWDVTSGNCIKTLRRDSNSVESISYSSDGKYLVSGSYSLSDEQIGLWEVATGKCIKTLGGHKGAVYSVVYSPDGKCVVSGSYDETVKLWEVVTGECIKTLGGQASTVTSVCYTTDAKHIVTGSVAEYERNWQQVGCVKIWEATTGKFEKKLEGHASYINCAVCSLDGKYVASGSADDTIKLWEIATGECIKTLKGHSDNVNSICYSPDGKYVISASGCVDKCSDKSVRVWEVASGRCIKILEEHTDWVNSVCYSSDGKYFASGASDGVKLYEAITGNCIKTLNGYIDSLCFSPDVRYIVGGNFSSIKLWEVATGECIKKLEGHTESVQYVCYSPDGKYLASGSNDGIIKLWNVSTGTCIKTLEGHTDSIRSVCYSPDGAYLASGSDDDTIKFWNASTGDLLATTFNLKDGEWLTYTPEGFFAGSEWATKNLVHIVDGMKTVGIDQMYDSLYRPDLVSAKLSGEDISPYAQKVNFASLMQTGSAPVVTFLSLEDEVKDRDVTIEFAIQNTGGGIGEVNLLLNGKNIRLAENVASKSGETVHFSHTITLQNGKNTVELYAKNEAGKVESLHISKTLNWQGNVKKPNLYIFTVAINKYRDRRLQLKYAVPDAEFILKGFSSQKKSLYQNIFTYHLFDDNVTKDGLKSSFEKLGDEVQADDVFVFYIAGHGITYDEDGDYYYLPSNFRFINSEAIQQQGISKNDLTRYLSLIKAGKTLMLMDTCNAGSFLGNNTRGLSEQTAIDRLTRSTGHATIVASSDDQAAMEGYEGHGIFTYILVEGLRGKADTDGDGFITLQELSAYTEEEVPRRSYEKWGYEQTPMRNLRRQDFPIYTSGNR